MVTIREIRLVRSQICIVLDTGETYWLSREDGIISGFAEGAEISQEDFCRHVRLCQYPKALNDAVAMLARRPCSTGEITARLHARRYIPEVVGMVLRRLEKENLLNDEDFCAQWIRYRSDHRYGPSRIRRELRMKGIPEDMIDAALDRMDPDEDRDHALALARKSWARMKPDEDSRKSRQKVIASLVRKGYDWETARAASDAAEQERK